MRQIEQNKKKRVWTVSLIIVIHNEIFSNTFTAHITENSDNSVPIVQINHWRMFQMIKFILKDEGIAEATEIWDVFLEKVSFLSHFQSFLLIFLRFKILKNTN